MLSLENVSKCYGQCTVLAPTTLEIPPRHTTVLIGPSGCGKTTVLKLIIGLLQPDSGTVCIDGVVLTPANATTLRHKLGYVIQEGGLFPHLSARRNVGLLAEHLGWDDTRIETRLNELAELTRFPHDALERYPTQLSGGQRQRLALMRALMLDPEILLLDEPLGALDPMIRYELQSELKAIFEALHKTVVLVTHDMGEAAYFGDEIILMREGHIVQRGSAAELTQRPAQPFVERFIRAQRTVFAPPTHEGNNP